MGPIFYFCYCLSVFRYSYWQVGPSWKPVIKECKLNVEHGVINQIVFENWVGPTPSFLIILFEFSKFALTCHLLLFLLLGLIGNGECTTDFHHSLVFHMVIGLPLNGIGTHSDKFLVYQFVLLFIFIFCMHLFSTCNVRLLRYLAKTSYVLCRQTRYIFFISFLKVVVKDHQCTSSIVILLVSRSFSIIIPFKFKLLFRLTITVLKTVMQYRMQMK